MALGLSACAAGVAVAVVARAGDALGVGGSPIFGWKQWVLLAAGAMLVGAGAVLVTPLVASIVRERPTAPRAARPRPHGFAGALVLAGLALGTAVLVWTRLVGLDQSLWHDEAFSVIHYAQGGPRTILGSPEYVPNDHVLFNLLSWATVETLGESPAYRRLWAVLPALLAVGLIAVWAWRRLGPGVTVVLVLLVTISPTHLELAKEARGYGLTFLCGAAMLVAADHLVRGGGRAALGSFALAGFAGIATLPVFAIAFVAQAAPLIARRRLRERVLLVVIAVGVASVGLYWSLLEDVVGNANQQFGAVVPWHGVVTGPIDALLGPLAGLPLDRPYRPDLVWRLAVGATLLVGFVLLVRRGDGALAAVLAAPLFGTYALLAVARFHAETRFSSFLLFHALIPVAIAIATAGAAVWRPLWSRPLAAAVAAVVVAVGLGRVLDLAKTQAAEPKEAFAEAAEVVRGTGISRVVSNTIRPEGLIYALHGRPLTLLPAPQLQALFCRGPAPFIFIEHPFTPSGPQTIDTTCLVRRGAARVGLLQRERGGFINVWILPEKPR